MLITTPGNTTPQQVNALTVQLEGLPDFNPSDGDRSFLITGFDGWFDTADPDAVWVGNAGAPGAVSSGLWADKEASYTLSGRIDVDRTLLMPMRQLLMQALPANREARIVCLGNELDEDKQIWVRRSGKWQIPPPELRLYFSVSLLGADPFKYGLTPLTGTVGVFTGEEWYRTYTQPGAPWTRRYTQNGSGVWVRSYVKDSGSAGYPVALPLTSNGDAASQRLTFTISGPLPLGSWWLSNDATPGSRLWANLPVTAGQQLVFDCLNKTATLNGADVSYLVYGDWLTLEPGGNLYRLVSGTPSAAFCTINALEAYR